MLSTATAILRASRPLFAAQMACAAQCLQACMDVALGVSEQQVDALETLFANSTVATRQWMWAGKRAQGWPTPAAHTGHNGQPGLAAPRVGAGPAADAGMAPPLSRE